MTSWQKRSSDWGWHRRAITEDISKPKNATLVQSSKSFGDGGEDDDPMAPFRERVLFDNNIDSDEGVDSPLKRTSDSEISSKDMATTSAKEQINAEEGEELERQTSSIKLDENFDLNKYIGNVSNIEPKLNNGGLDKSKVDDGFFDDPPDVEINQLSNCEESTINSLVPELSNCEESTINSLVPELSNCEESTINSLVPELSRLQHTKINSPSSNKEVTNELSDSNFLRVFSPSSVRGTVIKVSNTSNLRVTKPISRKDIITKFSKPTNLIETVQPKVSPVADCDHSLAPLATTPTSSRGVINKLSNTNKKEWVKPKFSIADYAIPSAEESSSTTPTSSIRELCRDDSITASLKRCIDKISFDNDLENAPLKKKIKNDDKSPDNDRHPLKQIDYNPMHEDYPRDEDIDNTEEILSENESTINETVMPFPNLSKDIHFDVRSIRNVAGNLRRKELGDKATETYLHQRRLTREAIEKMYGEIKNIPENSLERDPEGLKVKLMPHQRQALNWMKWRETLKPAGGILADDMGLGKTLQLISLVLLAKNERKERERAAGILDESDDDLDYMPVDYENCGSSRKVYDGRTLVVCPASLLVQWEREILTKVERNKLKVLVYHGDKRNNNLDEYKLSKYDIVLTTYGIVANEKKLCDAPKRNQDSRLFRIHWDRVILDEAHYIRNPTSRISVAACELRRKARWALTGTPIQNEEKDFYALLKFLKLHPFDDWKIWKRWVSNSKADGNKRLIVIVKWVLLRRTKAELMEQGLIQQLPEKKYTEIYVKLDPEERIVYQKMLLYSATFFDEFLRKKMEKENLRAQGYSARRASILTKEIPDKLSKILKLLMKTHNQDFLGMNYILVLILRLRQMCCHPGLVKSMLDMVEIDPEQNGMDPSQLENTMLEQLDQLMTDDEDDDDDYMFNMTESKAKRVMSSSNEVFNNRRKSSKVRKVLEIIDGIIDKGEKVVVVSQWTGFLEVIANNLKKMAGAEFEMYCGGVSLKNRQAIVDRINDKNDSLNILLLSLTAGGVGLNLTGANNLLLIDLHWNPQWERQAQDRIYRFGQQSNVHVYKFICKDTIEEKIKSIQDGKLQIANDVLTGTVSNRLTIEDLKILFSVTENSPEEGEPDENHQEQQDENEESEYDYY